MGKPTARYHTPEECIVTDCSTEVLVNEICKLPHHEMEGKVEGLSLVNIQHSWGISGNN